MVAVYSEMTVPAYPRKVRHFVDLLQRQLSINVMTMFVTTIGQVSAATPAFTLVAIKSVLTVHKVFEIIY